MLMDPAGRVEPAGSFHCPGASFRKTGRRARIKRSGGNRRATCQPSATPPDVGRERRSLLRSIVMGIIAWIVLGLIAGFIASLLVNKKGEGAFGDIILGIIGAVVGGLIAHL